MPTTAISPDRTDTRAAIVDAAATLLREHGAQAVTTRRVAQEAGVQAPTIYRLFGDKDGLLDAVAEHIMATYVTAKSATVAAEAGADPVDALRDGWRAHVDFGLANPHLFALLNAPGRAGRSPATSAGSDVLRARVRRLAAARRLRVDERRASTMIQAAGTGAVLALLALPPDERDPGLADAMYDAVAAAILTTAPAVPGTADAGATEGAGDTTALAVAFATIAPDLPALSDAERALLTEWLARAVDALVAQTDGSAARPQ